MRSNGRSRIVNDIHGALELMQSQYFELWIGGWPSAIDWTAAVMNTHVSSSLATLSRILQTSDSPSAVELDSSSRIEDHISTYFEHNLAFYFGENAFALRNEAFDDMLWVVLGWLESIKFVVQHDSSRYREKSYRQWHGSQFTPAFAHRARIFYNLASRGWDTRLCGGGMNWNPRLTPYKNAITNQLFISASVGMYLYFPGDTNSSPYMVANTSAHGLNPAPAHDPKYLQAAVDGYAWLNSSNMTNVMGLYVDGYHIKDWSSHNRTGTGNCDERNEMIYTYNQGVILSGLRGLWESTGDARYLEDGHQLVQNVLKATGWDFDHDQVLDNDKYDSNNTDWAGLGRAGILEELCDHAGKCSQDAQTFKGIYFLHLTQFCEPLPVKRPLVPGKTHVADKALASLHRHSCRAYGKWVDHNARAALKTRNSHGLFGNWWGHREGLRDLSVELPRGAVDYRNDASLLDMKDWSAGAESVPVLADDATGQQNGDGRSDSGTEDVNDRGRGRTVETQGGGLAVLRASWELSHIL